MSTRPEQPPPTRSRIDSESYQYRVFVPPDIAEDERIPLLVYLHGYGERGCDNSTQVERHIAPLLEKTQIPNDNFRAILLAPQSESGWWSGPRVNKLVDSIEIAYPVDRNRIYLIGISAGGGGCYVSIADRPQRWAASIPISAVCNLRSLPDIVDVPIWLIHGANDTDVRQNHSDQVYAYLAFKGANVRYSLIPDWEHGPWEPVFRNELSLVKYDLSRRTESLYEWLFSQQKETADRT